MKSTFETFNLVVWLSAPTQVKAYKEITMRGGGYFQPGEKRRVQLQKKGSETQNHFSDSMETFLSKPWLRIH